MSIDRPDNERLALYQRFKQSLAAHNDDEEFFDADDLVIIIDQAVDLDDEYVEIEAIMRGYRFFPDNEDIKARRAFLYYDLNLDEGVDNMRAQMPPESPLTEILAMRRMESSGNRETFIRMLDRIVSTPGMLDDETIIQLVDCASSCNCYEWLKSNEKKLRTKTDYLPTLLYELFIVADLNRDRPYSLKLLEELTEIEPFNIDFWNALAQLQATAVTDDNGNNTSDADFDAALVSTDFALAIDSKNIQAITLKASILLQTGRITEAAEVFPPAIQDALDPLGCEVFVRTVYELGRHEEAEQFLSRFCTKFPEARELFGLALAMNADELPALLKLHYEYTSARQTDSTESWTEWARAYYREGHLREAAQLMEVLRTTGNGLDYQTYKLYVSALYCMGNLDACIERFDEMLEHAPDMLMPDMIIAGMMSYLRKGNKREARKALKRLMENFPITIKNEWTLASNLESIGMSHFITAVQATLDSSGPIDTSELDIFRFPTTRQHD